VPQPYVEFPADGSSPPTCCQNACPVGTDVSAYVALVAQGRFDEALAVVREENPFPATCGRVCDHACEVHCRRGESDQPVAIRVLKRFLADRERAAPRWPHRIEPSRPEQVAIIGAGPAGLTAATDLLRRGIRATVFEALPMAGGMMRVGIPDYRLPPELLEFDLEHLRRLGIEIRLNAALGRDLTLSDLEAQGFNAVVLATGAHASRKLNVPGSDLPGLLLGVEFLRQVKLGEAPPLGRRVAVIGGGDVAMDVARTALRLGADSVDLYCLESRDEMPAHDWETREALDEQIRFHCGWGPVELLGHDRVEQVKFVACTSVFDDAGRFAPTFDASRSVTAETDTVVAAIGQVAQLPLSPNDGVEVSPSHLYRVDPATLQTTAPWIFAAGDAAYGTATVIQAVASGHRAAASVCEHLDGRPITGQWQPVRHGERVERVEIPVDWEERPPAEEPELPPQERVRSFAEVKLGLAEAAAIAEAARCMRCDYETDSYTYSRRVREEIYHLARDIGRDERGCLSFLQSKLSRGRGRQNAARAASPFDDLVFLPANLTRLVIDPYREPCNTRTVIGAACEKPLLLAAPVLIGGVPPGELSGDVLAALCRGAQEAGIAVRAPVGAELPEDDLLVMRVAPLAGAAGPIAGAAAVELTTAQADAAVDADALRAAAEAYRATGQRVPVGVRVSPGHVAATVQAAVAAGLEFVTLDAAEGGELGGPPRIEMLAEAIEGLRAINREEDIEIIYSGCVRGGGDAAKALALGAAAVTIGLAALVAAGDCEQEAEIEQGARRVELFVQSVLMEASILARGCGKSDVHNLEPEDLRSLTIQTSRATGVPLVGRDRVFRHTNQQERGASR